MWIRPDQLTPVDDEEQQHYYKLPRDNGAPRLL